jgi:broad specificity phosphatase PhoE
VNYLLLIKHSLPEIVESVPAHEWLLSAEGRRRCESLATAIAPYDPQVIISSREPKAKETARALANSLSRSFIAVDNLQEHDRSNTPFMSKGAFQANMREFFERPGQLVIGSETANAAHTRFKKAVNQVLADHPDETIALVAHGTVISLFVARQTDTDAFSLWQQLDLPSFVVLSLPDLKLVKIVESVEQPA